MTDSSESPPQSSGPAEGRRNLSRRGLLRAGGAAAVATAGASSVVSAQSADGARYTLQGVIPAADEFADSGYTGLYLHVGERESADIQASEISGCQFDNWSVDEVNVYNSMLIDRIQGSDKQQPTQVYTAAQSQGLDPGSLFVINKVRSCPEGYVGLQLEGLGYDLGSVDESTPTADGPIGGAGPGFGAGSALLGAGGFAALFQYLRSRNGE